MLGRRRREHPVRDPVGERLQVLRLARVVARDGDPEGPDRLLEGRERAVDGLAAAGHRPDRRPARRLVERAGVDEHAGLLEVLAELRPVDPAVPDDPGVVLVGEDLVLEAPELGVLPREAVVDDVVVADVELGVRHARADERPRLHEHGEAPVGRRGVDGAVRVARGLVAGNVLVVGRVRHADHLVAADPVGGGVAVLLPAREEQVSVEPVPVRVLVVLGQVRDDRVVEPREVLLGAEVVPAREVRGSVRDEDVAWGLGVEVRERAPDDAAVDDDVLKGPEDGDAGALGGEAAGDMNDHLLRAADPGPLRGERAPRLDVLGAEDGDLGPVGRKRVASLALAMERVDRDDCVAAVLVGLVRTDALEPQDPVAVKQLEEPCRRVDGPVRDPGRLDPVGHDEHLVAGRAGRLGAQSLRGRRVRHRGARRVLDPGRDRADVLVVLEDVGEVRGELRDARGVVVVRGELEEDTRGGLRLLELEPGLGGAEDHLRPDVVGRERDCALRGVASVVEPLQHRERLRRGDVRPEDGLVGAVLAADRGRRRRELDEAVVPDDRALGIPLVEVDEHGVGDRLGARRPLVVAVEGRGKGLWIPPQVAEVPGEHVKRRVFLLVVRGDGEALLVEADGLREEVRALGLAGHVVADAPRVREVDLAGGVEEGVVPARPHGGRLVGRPVLEVEPREVSDVALVRVDREERLVVPGGAVHPAPSVAPADPFAARRGEDVAEVIVRVVVREGHRVEGRRQALQEGPQRDRGRAPGRRRGDDVVGVDVRDPDAPAAAVEKVARRGEVGEAARLGEGDVGGEVIVSPLDRRELAPDSVDEILT